MLHFDTGGCAYFELEIVRTHVSKPNCDQEQTGLKTPHAHTVGGRSDRHFQSAGHFIVEVGDGPETRPSLLASWSGRLAGYVRAGPAGTGCCSIEGGVSPIRSTSRLPRWMLSQNRGCSLRRRWYSPIDREILSQPVVHSRIDWAVHMQRCSSGARAFQAGLDSLFRL